MKFRNKEENIFSCNIVVNLQLSKKNVQTLKTHIWVVET